MHLPTSVVPGDGADRFVPPGVFGYWITPSSPRRAVIMWCAAGRAGALEMNQRLHGQLLTSPCAG